MADPAAPAAPDAGTDAPVAAAPPVDAGAIAPPKPDAPSAAAPETPSSSTTRGFAELLDAGEVSIEDVLKHPKLQGHIGTLVDRQRREKADAEERDKRDALLDKAAEEDPDNPLAQERLKARQSNIVGRAASDLLIESIDLVRAKMPKEAQAEYDAQLKGRTYEGTYTEGLAAHLQDLQMLARKHDPEVKRLITEAREAGRKEALAEVNGNEPSHDLGSGTPTGGLTPERYRSMSAAERRKLTPTEIDTMTQSAMRRTAA